VPVAQEAAGIYRELAATDPGRYRADLALALGVLALSLDGLGLTAEADAARRDADLDQ
jgi:hypothetical protein